LNESNLLKKKIMNLWVAYIATKKGTYVDTVGNFYVYKEAINGDDMNDRQTDSYPQKIFAHVIVK